jgi:branched-chain amino acid transport system ATP-binding protein
VSAALLEVRDLHAGYGAGPVLFGVDLSVGRGEIVGLLGRNGMGKTTLVRAITGLLAPAGGGIAFDGTPIGGWPAHRVARRGIALVPEGRQVFPNLTVREHLTAFRREPARAGAAIAGDAAIPGGEGPGGPTAHEVWTPARALELFPALAGRQGHYGSELSGGEQQMLAIARALVTNPRLLVLDEATEGLAPLVREEIWRALRRLRGSGLAMLVIDKHVQRLVDTGDRHLILEKGRVAWRGTSAGLEADRAAWSRLLGV